MYRGCLNENRRYCSGAFLDITEAFDKVWHQGLLNKLNQFPAIYYQVLESFITSIIFKQQEEVTKLYSIKSRVPQESVLGPILYLIYTAGVRHGVHRWWFLVSTQ